MKLVILAGGFGTRIGEETHLKPKPMVEIGGMPILWHIMKIFPITGSTNSLFARVISKKPSRNILRIMLCIIAT
jgi:choline kinase